MRKTTLIVSGLALLATLPALADGETCSSCIGTCLQRGATISYCEVLCRSLCGDGFVDPEASREAPAQVRTEADSVPFVLR